MDSPNRRMIDDIRIQIQEYQIHAQKVTKYIIKTESMRTRIINTIEEAKFQQEIDGRIASLLEDKLSRPYAKLLVL